MENQAGICQPPNSGVSASLSDIAPAVLQQYFDENPNTFLSTHHIQSYEAFIFRELPELILAENPITILKEPLDAENGVYKYKVEIFIGGDADTPEKLRLSIGSPVISLDEGTTVRRMFPNEARIRDLTYSSTFNTSVLIRITYTRAEPSKTGTIYTTASTDLTYDNFTLFHIPILLRSKLCATYKAPKSLLMEMGECRNDAGGYFIIDGAEKVLITRQEQAFNSVYISTRPPTDEKLATYASVICQHPVTKQTRRVALYRMRSEPKDAIRISIPFVKGPIPLFALFRALGVISDRDIIRMILPDTSAANNTAMENTLIASVEDAQPIASQVQALEFIRTLTKGFIVENVLDIMYTHLFSHVPNRPLAKAQYLAELVRRMIRVEMRMEPNTNRDDIRNQRLLPTGSLLRGLFSDCWKVWIKKVSLTVDETYRYNRSQYSDENFADMFNAARIKEIMSSEILDASLLRGFRGKWGTDAYNTKSGVLQPLARISYMDAMSHLRRVVSDFDTSMKLVGPRHLNPSQIGYFCTSETPTGSHIGATKNMSILTAISISCPTERLMDWLFRRGEVTEVAAATQEISVNSASVQINGGTVGFSARPDLLTNVLKHLKWTACLPPTTSISFNTADNSIRIYLDDGRPLRPLWHLTQGVWPHQATTKPLAAWRDLVCGTLPLTAAHGIYSAKFVDPLETPAGIPEPDEPVTLADYIPALAPFIGAIEYVDPYEGNEAYISWYGNTADLTPQHTHAEIHPSTMLGLLASMIPFANHNQSPRNQLSCSQSKQAIGYYATNYENRFDTYGSMLCYGEGAMARTIVHEAVAGGAMPYGTNLIFCINSFNGYNQDDGILFNRSSIQRGLFRSIALRSYTGLEEIDTITKVRYRIGNPRTVLGWTELKPGYDYSALDDNGIIKEGTVIHDKMVLVGRYLTDKNGRVADASVLPTVFTVGHVDKVVVIHQANGMRLVRVRILEERVPELGDKFSSRHGQKGTMGMLLDAQDMPRTADGLVPDVIVNPHCIPSRMTIAQLLEQLFGKLGAVVGAKMNATTFMNDDQSLNAIGDALESIGLQRAGEEILYSGISGRMFTSSVFMGPLYFMRLKHLTQDKLNVRGVGRKELRTHQPTGGRGNEGGMRIGEMERDVLIAHGVTDFLQESMMKRSDGTSFWVCNGCGTMPIYNESNRLFVCPLCDGPVTFQGDNVESLGLVLPVKKSRTTFSRIEVPYALKLLDQELTTYANMGVRYLTEKTVRRFRDLPSGTGTFSETPEPTPVPTAAPAVAATDLVTSVIKAITPSPVVAETPTKDEAAANAMFDFMPEGEQKEEMIKEIVVPEKPVEPVAPAPAPAPAPVQAPEPSQAPVLEVKEIVLNPESAKEQLPLRSSMKGGRAAEAAAQALVPETIPDPQPAPEQIPAVPESVPAPADVPTPPPQADTNDVKIIKIDA